MATVNDLDLHMFDQYVNSARTLMGELSKLVGDSYNPGENYDITNAIHRAQAVSLSVMTMLQSLHAAHPPMIPLLSPNVPGVPPNPPPNFPGMPETPPTMLPSAQTPQTPPAPNTQP